MDYRTSEHMRPMHWLSLALLSGVFACGLTACAGSSPAVERYAAPAVSELEANGLERQFEQVARSVTPSIVAISALGASSDTGASLLAKDIDAPRLAAALNRVSRTVGTGFVIDADGYILTAEHVVADAVQLWVTTDDHKVYPAMVVASDPRSDLAVLKVPARDLKAVTFAPPDSIRRGQWALTLGNPYGLATEGDLSLSVGVVSATGRSLPKLSAIENRLYSDLIQTTAQINPGNSGGPLLDLQGQVIGVNAAVVLPQKNTNGIGFAFTVSDELLEKIDQLKKGQAVRHAQFGVVVSSAFLDNIGGARIDRVEPAGPAAEASVRINDVVTRIENTPIPNADMFARVVSGLSVNRPARIHLLRNGRPLTLYVRPTVRPAEARAVYRDRQRLYWRGMLLGHCASGFVVQSIDGGSPFLREGIQQGMIITGVGGQAAASLIDLFSLLSGSDSVTCKLDMVPSPTAPGDSLQASAAMR